MMRAGFLLLALALVGVFSAPAQAVQSARTKEVAKSRAEVVRYWTAERMRTAQPLDEVKGATGAVERAALAYPFTRYEPSPYNAAHGKVFFSDGAANYVCSGTALNSGNQSVVWTAGHCVNEGPGGFYTNWVFVPGYKDGAAPYGTWAAENLLTTSGWGNGGDFGVDLGAAVVRTERVRPDAHERGRQPRDRVQPGGRAALPVARLPGRAPVHGRAHVHLRRAAGHPRHVVEPGDDGDRLRHDRRVLGRRLGRRQRRALGQLVRLHHPAERDVRPVSGLGGAEPVHVGVGQLIERLTIRSPEPGGHVPPGGALRVALAVEPGWEALASRLLVDGDDVTAACRQRVAATWPPSRVDLIYKPPRGWAPGPHEATLLVPGAHPDTWRFTT